jgi:hypothetical protein
MNKVILPLSVALLTGAIACSSAAPKESVTMVQEKTTIELDDQGSRIENISQDTAASAKDVVAIKLVATVEKIDLKNRKLTFVDANGHSETLKVGPEVKRLNEIKVGDRIAVEYFQSWAFELTKPTAEELKNPRTQIIEAGRADMSSSPAATGVARMRTIVNVEAIDLSLGTITIKVPEGDKLTIKARHPERLERVSVGDTIAVTFTEAVAVSVTAADKIQS